MRRDKYLSLALLARDGGKADQTFGQNRNDMDDLNSYSRESKRREYSGALDALGELRGEGPLRLQARARHVLRHRHRRQVRQVLLRDNMHVIVG